MSRLITIVWFRSELLNSCTSSATKVCFPRVYCSRFAELVADPWFVQAVCWCTARKGNRARRRASLRTSWQHRCCLSGDCFCVPAPGLRAAPCAAANHCCHPWRLPRLLAHCICSLRVLRSFRCAATPFGCVLQEGLSADAALEQVRRARRMAEPNEGFMKQLRLLGSSSEHKGWADACRAMRTSGSSAAASTAAAEGAAGSGDGDVAAASSEAKSDAAGKAGDGGSETAAISAGS